MKAKQSMFAALPGERQRILDAIPGPLGQEKRARKLIDDTFAEFHGILPGVEFVSDREGVMLVFHRSPFDAPCIAKAKVEWNRGSTAIAWSIVEGDWTVSHTNAFEAVFGRRFARVIADLEAELTERLGPPTTSVSHVAMSPSGVFVTYVGVSA